MYWPIGRAGVKIKGRFREKNREIVSVYQDFVKVIKH